MTQHLPVTIAIVSTPPSRRFILKAGFAGLGAVALGGLTACGAGDANGSGAAEAAKKLTVAASPAPHADIFNSFAASRLKEEGIELVVKEYTDYILPRGHRVRLGRRQLLPAHQLP